MDKRYLIKMICLNTLWVAWIVLSALFGYLIAKSYFPDNIAMFIPFSLLFLVAGGAVAFIIIKLLKKRTTGGGAGSNANGIKNDGALSGTAAKSLQDSADRDDDGDTDVKQI